MPALQTQKTETLRKKYVAAIKALPIAQSQKATAIAQSKSLTRDMLLAQLGGAVTQSSSKARKQAAIKRQSAKRQSLKKVSAGQSAGAGRFSAKLQAKRQSQKQAAARQSQKQAAAARTSAKKRKSRKSRKGASVGKNIQIPKALRARVGRLVRAIKAGKIVAKQQRGIAITSPSSYAPIGARDASGAHGRYERFDTLYKGVRVTRKSLKSRKSKKVARMSVKKRFQTIKEQKFPYQLVKGYRVPARVVGGGGGGAGVIKAIPGSGAAPFHSLSAADQAKVAAFLNAAGAKLRGKGAPKKVSLQAMRQQAAKQVARRASIKSRKSRKSVKKGAANR